MPAPGAKKRPYTADTAGCRPNTLAGWDSAAGGQKRRNAAYVGDNDPWRSGKTAADVDGPPNRCCTRHRRRRLGGPDRQAEDRFGRRRFRGRLRRPRALAGGWQSEAGAGRRISRWWEWGWGRGWARGSAGRGCWSPPLQIYYRHFTIVHFYLIFNTLHY